MSNQYNLKHNDDLLTMQYEDKIGEINEEIERSLYQSFSDIVGSLINNIKGLFLDLGKPSFQNRQAFKNFSSDDYNKNVKEISNDIKNAFNSANNLQEMVREGFNYSATYNKHLKKRVKNASKLIEDVDTYTNNSDENIVTISEDFNDKTKLDINSTTAQVMPERGLATLGIAEASNSLSKNTKVQIMGDSNGFPGNLHQVEVNKDYSGAVDQDDQEKNIKFYREDDPHLHAVLVIDNEPDSWFEYELCNFPEDKKVNPCKGYGLEFDSGEVWAKDPENGVLKLHLRIILDKPKILNWLDIVPYQFPFDGAKPAQIVSIKTAPDEKTNPTPVYFGERADQNTAADTSNTGLSEYEKIFQATQNIDMTNKINNIYKDDITEHTTATFSARTVKVIDVVMEQDTSYDCKIGHIYYERVTKVKITETSWFGLKKDTSTETIRQRIEGPKMNLKGLMVESNKDLGAVALGTIGGAVAGSKLGGAIGSAFGPIGTVIGAIGGAILGSLWGSTEKDILSDKVETGVEAFDGWRYAIGIREIMGNSHSYRSTDSIVSQSYQLPGEAKKITLDSFEDIPDVFYSDQSEQTSYTNRNEWIKYYFSFNDGQQWHRITPVDDYASDIPNTYYINTDLQTAPVANKNTAFINTEGKADRIQFKTVLSRPTDIDEAAKNTPRLNKYKYLIRVDQGDDIDEY